MSLNRSPLHALHVKLGARLVDFAGWEMPLQYTGIVEEHLHTRSKASFFDVSHMGRLRLEGPGTEGFLERICTRKLAGMTPGRCRYSHICRQGGGVLDDVIVSRYEDDWGIVCNASNREKIVNWLKEHKPDGVTLIDGTLSTAMVAMQGPETIEFLATRVPFDVNSIKRYGFITGSFMEADYAVFRSGYTGEDGFEVIVPAAAAQMAVNFLMDPEKISNGVIKPAGLGARDTLRLEAGMPLYGHELTEDWDSLTAGQEWCVDLTKDFIGAEAMRKIKERGPERKLVGMEIEGRRPARQGCVVRSGGRDVGIVTSGTFSPTFTKCIAMGLVRSDLGDEGTMLVADIRGTDTAAKVVPLPFYERAA